MRFSDGDVEWAGCTGLGAGRGLGWRQKFATRVHMAVETPGVEESPREGVHREEGWQAGIGVHSFSSTRVEFFSISVMDASGWTALGYGAIRAL